MDDTQVLSIHGYLDGRDPYTTKSAQHGNPRPMRVSQEHSSSTV